MKILDCRIPTAWLKADDGFLVLDRNLYGKTDSGKELFSNAVVALSLGGLESILGNKKCYQKCSCSRLFLKGCSPKTSSKMAKNRHFGHGMAWEVLKIARFTLMCHK